MREVHLICNAHIDPIWQWDWKEGAATALATFRSAVDLADEFDFIFCHNEANLYKYIEEYAPTLFERIKELIRVGKWHIMGGWYLQPDCNLPQGESFVRQALMGRQYFMEKFGKWSKTAINTDPFGHTRGLVQIISKCGQDNYLVCRVGDDQVPADQFVWEGYDGSRIKVNWEKGYYNTLMGNAVNGIKGKLADKEDDIVCVLWGVGNHGGGPSRKDLADIEKWMEKESLEILHSTPDHFFAKINPSKIYDKSLRTSMPGCYTSMSLIKQKHAELENKLYMVEKLCSMAAIRGLIEYPMKELNEVVEDLLYSEFHDVLPGSSVRAGENDGIRFMDHALQILERLQMRAYLSLCSLEEKAKEGEYPVLVLNPNPYQWETEIDCELMLSDQNWSETIVHIAKVLDENGSPIPCQMIKEESNLSLDWRKRILFKAKLKPFSLTRFSVYMEEVQNEQKSFEFERNVIVDIPELKKHVEIDGKTGLIRSYRYQGKEYIKSESEGAFCPVFYKDNPDPWAMKEFQLHGLGSDPKRFELMVHPDGPFEGMKSLQIIEDGEIYTGVECFMKCENTRIRVEYDIYKTNPAVDIKVDVFMNDPNRMLKLSIPTDMRGEYIGQTAFGTETLYMDGRECVAQRFVAMNEHGQENCLALFNRGTYGYSWKDGNILISLLRGVTYCAHPILERPIISTNRFTKKIDMGERSFVFRLMAAKEKELERLATEFNVPPYACNVFPVNTDQEIPEFTLNISNPNIVLVAMKKSAEKEGYVLRLLNNHKENCDAAITCGNAKYELSFGKYEAKTLLYREEILTELSEMII